MSDDGETKGMQHYTWVVNNTCEEPLVGCSQKKDR